MPSDWGDGSFEFGRWETPFENTDVEVLEVAWGGGPRWGAEHRPAWSSRSLFKSPYEAMLDVLVQAYTINLAERTATEGPIYRVSFKSDVSAFRVLDEGGLMEFWAETKRLGGRPGTTTFRVRNHDWSKESFLSFFHANGEGWSYVIATGDDCLEVIARDPPQITLEQPTGPAI